MTRSYRWHDEPVVRPTLFVVPAGQTEYTAPSGYTIRVRGAGGCVTHSYRCPVHGLFDASVSRADVPDAVACPADITTMMGPARCNHSSPWAGSLCGIGFAPGEVTS